MPYILTIVTAALITIGSLMSTQVHQQVVEVETVTPDTSEQLGSDIKLFAGFPYYLAGTGISSSGTSFTLTSFTISQNGQKIQDSDLESTFYFTLEPGNRTRQEIIGCTTVTQNANNTATISGCSRGLSPIQPYTASTTLQFAHAGGSVAILSDPPQLFDDLYDYVNTLGLGSTSVAATELQQGYVELATQAEMAASTETGGTGSKLVLQSRYATSTYNSATAANRVVVTKNNGKIDSNFIDNTNYLQVASSTGASSTITHFVGTTVGTAGTVGTGNTAFVWNYPIPANTLVASSELRFEIPVINFNHGGAGASDCTITVQVGSSTIGSFLYSSLNESLVSGGPGKIVGSILATTTSRVYSQVTANLNPASTASFRYRSTVAYTTLDYSIIKDLAMTVSSASGNSCVYDFSQPAKLEIIKG